MACNGYFNRDPVVGEVPTTLSAFCDIRDRILFERKARILERRETERVWFNTHIRPERTAMTRVAVEFEWQPVGEVTLVDGKPRFPSLPRAPGAYRLAFYVPDAAARVYIGETDDLHRRAQNYRTPGPMQRTSLRMNQELVDALTRGVRVSQATVP